MKFKGTIIITDPCYIVLGNNYSDTALTSDDWLACNYGKNMKVLGITNYISERTIYGDWMCETYRIKENPIDTIDSIVEANRQDNYIDLEAELIGKFTANSGQVGVFLLDEVRKYNPGIDDWIRTNPYSITTIEDFDGEVEYYVDNDEDAHICGTGNINFFTTRTGL
ncbi:hypothetical protein [Intestinibacter sp.]|uniref:hypothetical protein n=1 Tax=Intestinibacter sp. TaxID=1965304 RepID=UPI003F155D76